MRVLTGIQRVSMMNERLYGLYDSRKLFKIDFSTTRELKFVWFVGVVIIDCRYIVDILIYFWVRNIV